MQLTTLLYTALPLLAAAAPQGSGGSFPKNFARVENYCPFKAYVQSVPNAPAGGAPSSVLELGPNGSSFYQEEQKSGGSALRVGTLPALRTPLSMGNCLEALYEVVPAKSKQGTPHPTVSSTMISAISSAIHSPTSVFP